MSLYVHVNGDGDLVGIGPLPVRALNHLTNQWVDPRDNMRATGYADVETATLEDLPPNLTPAQRDTIISAVTAARHRLQRRRNLAADAKQVLNLARVIFRGYIEMDPAAPSGGVTIAPHDEPPPTPGQVSQSLIYSYGRVQQVAYLMVGDGSDNKPGLVDIISVLVDVAVGLLEDADEFDPSPED